MKTLSSLTILTILILAQIFPGVSPKASALDDAHQNDHEGSASAGALAVSVGYYHACAITADGGVLCWGANWAAQLGNGSWSESLIPTRVVGLNGISKIVSGEDHTCALTTTGGVKCWGINGEGELGDGTTNWASPTPVDTVGLSSGVIALGAGFHHTCAINNAGGVKCWGRNSTGQLGDGTTISSNTPVNVVGLSSGAVAVAAGIEHTCALISGGAVKCWGRNWAGQLGNGTFVDSLTPVTVSGLSSGATVLAVGAAHTCASTGTGVKCWGRNWENQLGDGTQTFSDIPVNVLSLSDMILSISAGYDFTCALNNQGNVKCWGRNSEGQLGDGTSTDRLYPVLTQELTGGVSTIASNGQSTCAMLTSGAAKCWGVNNAGQAGDNTASRLLKPESVVNSPSPATSLSVGFNDSCLIANDGKAYCWGVNNWWQIGDTTRTDRPEPRQVSDLTGVSIISNGGEHSCALLSTGGVKCWGFGWAGQLGNGTWDMQSTPVDVVGLTSGVLKISSGLFHTCAITSIGGVKCWGRNEAGQLGNGTTDWSSTPVDVTGLSSGVLDVASGYNHTCAILSSGHVKCWGTNWAGQLGDGTTNSSLVPVDVLTLTNAIAISLGVDHTCALTSLGGMKCWGSNSEGGLGDGTFNNQSSPVDVSGLASGVTKIAVGAYHSCALLSNGSAQCWGWNVYGQLGDNTIYRNSLPVSVIGINGSQSIDAGGDHTCALLNGGTIKCWGSNGYGQLGLGNTPWKLIPVGVLLYSVKLPLIRR